MNKKFIINTTNAQILLDKMQVIAYNMEKMYA